MNNPAWRGILALSLCSFFSALQIVVAQKGPADVPPAAEVLRAAYPGVQRHNTGGIGGTTLFYGFPMSAAATPAEAAGAWLAAHASAFGINNPDLRLLRSHKVGPGRFTLFTYQQHLDGVPVEANVTQLLILNGSTNRVVYAAATGLITAPEAAFPANALDAAAALAVARALPGYAGLDDFVVVGIVVFQPGAGALPVRAWKVAGTDRDGLLAYTFYVDAASGKVVHVQDDVMHAAGVSGSVAGYVSPGTHPFVPTNPQLELKPLTSLRVQADQTNSCAEVNCAGNWGVTDAAGGYSLAVPAGLSLSVLADLQRPSDCSAPPLPLAHGPWVHVINCASADGGCVPPMDPLLPNPECFSNITSTDPPPNIGPFVFNEPAAADEFTTAQVNCFYQVTLLHDFLKARQPDFDEIDVAIRCFVNTYECAASPSSTNILRFGRAGPLGSVQCVNMAYSTIIAHEYGHLFLIRRGIGNNQTFLYAFHEGFADALAILMHESHSFGTDICGPGTTFRDYTFTETCGRILYPCMFAPPQCPGECVPHDQPHGCAKLLAGIWWDIKLNAERWGSCGLGFVQQLFTDWSLIATGGEPGTLNPAWSGTAIQVLTKDDNDGTFANGTPHDCLICDAFLKHNIDCPSMWDANANRVPDQCEVAGLYALCPGTGPTNRYVSFALIPGPVPGRLKVTRTSPSPSVEVGWIGAPDANGICQVLPAMPAARLWTEPVIHVGDCEIIPDATYEIRATANGGQTFSPPLTLSTTPHWCDVVGTGTGTGFTPPNGVVNFTDVLAVVLKFLGGANAPPLTWVDVQKVSLDDPCLNHMTNMADIYAVVRAFVGEQYPFITDPTCCPSCPDTTPPPGCPHGLTGPGFGPEGFGPESGGGVAFDLTIAPYQAQAGQTATVEVYVTGSANLGVFETALALTPATGTVGTLTLESLTIASTRTDYTFYGQSTLGGTNLAEGKAGAALSSGSGINIIGPDYLATYVYRASAVASGVWEVRVADPDTTPTGGAYLLDGNAIQIAADLGSTRFIRVGVECTLPTHCDDGKQCTSDACTAGVCVHTNLPNGTPCNDGLFCTATDTCKKGNCIGGVTTPCTGTDVCCESLDSCIDPEIGCPQ